MDPVVIIEYSVEFDPIENDIKYGMTLADENCVIDVLNILTIDVDNERLLFSWTFRFYE